METWLRNWRLGVSPCHAALQLPSPDTLSLFPGSQTVTWQSARWRCDCWSNSSRSNTKRLLIFIKSSLFHLSIFHKRELHIHYLGTALSRNFEDGKHMKVVCKSALCVPACICVCVCHKWIVSSALLSAMSVISSKNPSDGACAAFQGYSVGLLNSRSHSAPITPSFDSLNKAVFC